MIVHGTKDPLVPYQQSVEFEKILENAGVPVVFVTVEDGGHGKGFPAKTDSLVKPFVDYHLLGVGVLPEDQVLQAQ